jgi:hypothetical protein
MRSSVLVVLAAVAFGCSSNPEPEDQANLTPGACPPGQYCPSAQPTTTTTGTTTAPAPTTTGTTAAGGACSPIAVGAFATPLLTGLQQSEAAGMQPEGSSAAGQCAEGQQFELPLTLQPGKCYTVISVSMGVQELDAQIATQPVPQAPPLVLAQDNASGGQAVVAGKGSCFKNPSPIAVPGKVIIKATRGAGAAVAQVYVK